ncbi:NUDIX domain-containing protein [Fibrobacter sp. UWB12]|uniref:NUDIX hydrolase n=1 Tax=Fibrobacter sp. UWB12 TaxID=1896203 RepID=UPI00091D120C|nr:NUDIX domain-containing protein [Fibrobacter sp. UWB12]SHK78409.1 Isopentenyldiphosphate isomerase [Fibrobacter sp. UWB12]
MAEEMIDILNSDGTPAGYARGRTEVHAKGLWHRTVHIWAFDTRGRIVFQLRSHLKENNPNLLDTSCAGHITAGDDSRNAAIRELREEMGVEKRLDDLEYLFEATHENVLNNGTYFDNEYYDTFKIILSDEEAAHLVPQPGEVDDFVWMTPAEFLENHAKKTEKFVDHPKDYAWIRSILNTQK